MKSDTPDKPSPPRRSTLSHEVGIKAARKLRARRRADRTVWFGLGMMGLIGWSVSIPSLLGALAGWWLDRHYPGDRSWTLAMLVAGMILGCWNAWYWIAREGRAIRKEEDDDGK